MKNGSTSHTFSVALIQADHDGLCRSVSPELLAWHGAVAADIVGQFIFQLFSPESRTPALAAWERIVASKESGRFEVVLNSKSGASLAAIVELAPVRGISAITDHWIVALQPAHHAPPIDEGELRLLRAELTETRRRADDQLGALKEEIAQIQRAKDLLLSSIEEDSKKRIAELESALAAARTSNAPPSPAEDQSVALRQTITDLETQARASSAEHTAHIARLTAELETLRQKITALPSDTSAVSEPADATLRAENLTLTARIRSAEEEISTLRRELTLAKDDVARRSSEPSPTPELESLRRELSEMRAARDTLLTTAQVELQAALTASEQRLTAASATAAEAARRELETLRADLGSEREVASAARAAAATAQTELQSLQEQRSIEQTEASERIHALTRRLEESEKLRSETTATLEEQRRSHAELERSAAESSQFAQTAAREFKELLRKTDTLSLDLTTAREEVTRHTEAGRRATERESELTTALKAAQREVLTLREERDTARSDATRLERERGDATVQHQHTTNELFERTIAEVTIRLNRILRLFFALPDLRPEAPLCSTVATARTAAEDLVHSLERIHEYWLIESGGFALRRDNFGLRSWISSAAALYEFKAMQRDLTLTMMTDPEVPDVVSTDGARLVEALSQIADYIVETATPGSILTFSATVLSATARDVRMAFEFSAPCESCDQTTAQQLSLSVAERIIQLLGGEFNAIEAPGDVRRVRVTLGLLRGIGAPVPVAPRSRRRTAREEIDAMPMRPVATATGKETSRTFGVDRSLLAEEDYHPAAATSERSELAAHAPRGTIIPRATPPEEQIPTPVRVVAPVEVPAEPVEIPSSPSDEERQPLPASSNLETDESVATPLRILLAEDNKLNQRMIGDILKTRGYTVVLAGDGREAFTHLTTARFDLALIDCEMPTMDGYTATREIRAAEARVGRHTPIFAMTVYLDNDVESRCLDAGTDELLTKPVRADALFGLIDRYFPNRRP